MQMPPKLVLGARKGIRSGEILFIGCGSRNMEFDVMKHIITSDDWKAFGEAHSKDLPADVDNHALFAEKVGLSREEGKQLSFRMIHSNKAFKTVLDATKEYAGRFNKQQ